MVIDKQSNPRVYVFRSLRDAARVMVATAPSPEIRQAAIDARELLERQLDRAYTEDLQALAAAPTQDEKISSEDLG